MAGKREQMRRWTAAGLVAAMASVSVFSLPGLQTFANQGKKEGVEKVATKANGDRASSSQTGFWREDGEKGEEKEEALGSQATASQASPSQATAANALPMAARSVLPMEAKYDRTEGSMDVTNLQVPTLAYDDTSITLVWNKPEKYDQVADYAVYRDGEQIGTARENFAEHADWASTYMDAFYEYYQKKSNVDMVSVDIHSFTADGLEPDTEYEFSVAALDEDGNQLGVSDTITASTTPAPEIFNVTDYGAEPVEKGYTSYDEEKNQFIEQNTRAIQAAIDACSEGGKVVIPEGIFMSGALYLKSNMTLELEKGAVLFGSPNADHYDSNYLLYPYSTDTRSWALLNAYSSDENGMLENIRITGEGTIDGNGWKYGKSGTISGDGTQVYYQSSQSGDPDFNKHKEYRLPQWVAGSSSKLYGTKLEDSLGILAADATLKAKENGVEEKAAYNNRPNLIVIRGTENVYIGGITVRNPAFHTVAVLDSRNVTSNNVKYTTYDSNNADGIELGNTQNAMVFNNFFDTGDDSINFATGMGKGVQDSEQKPSKNIWTFNNFLREGHGGAIAAGSHTGAGICDMLVEDNVLNHSDMPFRFKSAPVNGGGVYDVLVRDCAVGDAQQAFVMSTSYSDANQAVTVEPADTPAEFYNIDFYNITIDKTTKNTISLTADVAYDALYKPWHTHHDLYFQDIVFTNAKAGTEVLTGIENAVFYNVTINGEEESSAAWKSISACRGLVFAGETTISDNAERAMTPPEWTDEAELTATESNAQAASPSQGAELSWTKAEGASGYIVETYVGDGEEPVDITATLTKTSAVLEGLSPDTEYRFAVYAVNKTGDKTEGPSVTLKTEPGEEGSLLAPASLAVAFEGEGYTWATADFDNAWKADPRIRGYRAYVNGSLVKTIYNYELQNGKKADRLSITIGRMMETENQVRLEAFSDDGRRISYQTGTVTLSHKYDFKAPEWEGQLTAERRGDQILLRWEEPWDESGIYGYRVYVDERPQYRRSGDYFNQVNDAYTTKESQWTVSGLDLTKSHSFRVEAADAWWKALDGSGPYHWTNSGPQAFWSPVQLSLSQETASLQVGETLQLTASVTPDQTPLVWSSSNQQAAVVDQKGLVLAVGAGTAQIQAAAADKTAVCVVTITNQQEDMPGQPGENPGETPEKPEQPGEGTTQKPDSGNSGGGNSGSHSSGSDSGSGSSGDRGSDSGNGAGSSKWLRETVWQNGQPVILWRLRHGDGSFASGSMGTDASGAAVCQPAWEKVNGSWYAFDQNGYAMSGFIWDPQLNGWFYVDIAVGMKTGWQQIDGAWYYWNPVSDGTQGMLYTGKTTPDGYEVNEKGVWDGNQS